MVDSSLKARNIQRDNRISICVADQAQQYSFVTIQGVAKIYHYKQSEPFKWTTKIVRRYVGKYNAEAYGKPSKIIAEKDTAEWE